MWEVIPHHIAVLDTLFDIVRVNGCLIIL